MASVLVLLEIFIREGAATLVFSLCNSPFAAEGGQLAHDDLDLYGRAGGNRGENVAAYRLAVHGHSFDAFFQMVRVLHNDFIGCPAPDTAQGKAVHLVRDAGVDLQPASVGWMPRMYWLTSTNVQAAVPVSQLFFASPKVAASQPATIWL